MTEELINKKIGQNIKKYRLLYNINDSPLTQEKLAKKIGVSKALIGNLESKNKSQGISLFNLYKISEVLNVPIQNFFE